MSEAHKLGMSENKETKGTYSALDRNEYPTFADVWAPFGSKKMLVPGFKYNDGAVSRALLTNSEWEALTPETRAALTVGADYLEL